MAIEKRTVIDQIEITQGDVIQIRFALQLVEDGVVINSSWHRTTVPPGVDPQMMIDAVNADITNRPSLRAAAIQAKRIPLLKSICSLVHTPDVVVAHRAREAAAMTELLKRGNPS